MPIRMPPGRGHATKASHVVKTCVPFLNSPPDSKSHLNPRRWDSFQRLFDESGCADIPWVVLPGNHDRRKLSGFCPFQVFFSLCQRLAMNFSSK